MWEIKRYYNTFIATEQSRAPLYYKSLPGKLIFSLHRVEYITFRLHNTSALPYICFFFCFQVIKHLFKEILYSTWNIEKYLHHPKPRTPLLFLNKEETIPEPRRRNIFSSRHLSPFKLWDLSGGVGRVCYQLEQELYFRQIWENFWFIEGLGIKMNNLKINNCIGWAIRLIYLLMIMAMISSAQSSLSWTEAHTG